MQRRRLLLAGLGMGLVWHKSSMPALAQPIGRLRYATATAIVSADRFESLLKGFVFRLSSLSADGAVLSESAAADKPQGWANLDEWGDIKVDMLHYDPEGSLVVEAASPSKWTASAQCSIPNVQRGFLYFLVSPIYESRPQVTREVRPDGTRVERKTTDDVLSSITIVPMSEHGQTSS